MNKGKAYLARLLKDTDLLSCVHAPQEIIQQGFEGNLATDGLQILAVKMTDAQYIRMEGKYSYILSRSLS